MIEDIDFVAAIDHVEDDVLRLMFVCCHPALTPDAQTTLTLQAGRRADARGRSPGRSSPPRRPSRSGWCGPSGRWPTPAPRWRNRPGRSGPSRLDAVLGVIYLLFNEGYSATAGDDWMRPALCDEALRLGRILAALVPTDAEVHGLLGADGAAVVPAGRPHRAGRRAGAARRPGPHADGTPATCGAASPPWTAPRRWAASRARTPCRPRSPPAMPRARTAEETDWVRIADLYEQLARQTGSAGRRGEPGGRAGHGLRPGGRAAPRGPARRPAGAARTTTCCPACAATCWPGSAGTRRRGRSSLGPPS